jgi:hypothetical protein
LCEKFGDNGEVSFKDVLDRIIYKVYIYIYIKERERECRVIEKRKREG